MLQESELDARVLADALRPLLDDREKSLEMASAARNVRVADSAEQVANACREWVAA